tara:strand:- start:107 stop:307 length:201 start_codon:yes stop_codon:yes gene_type:complete
VTDRDISFEKLDDDNGGYLCYKIIEAKELNGFIASLVSRPKVKKLGFCDYGLLWLVLFKIKLFSCI